MDGNKKYLASVFAELPQPKDKIQCQYVWIDGSLRNLRTKSTTWQKNPLRAEELPVMEFCGSATNFDVGDEADYYSHPAKLYGDPFRGGDNKLVLCETRTRDNLPTFANNRHRLRMVQKKKGVVLDFSFYQPYCLQRSDGKPLSYLDPAYTSESKSGFVCGQVVAKSHYAACLNAGIQITSMEPLSNQGQWKYGIGPCSSANLGDDVWMSRFLLTRVAEDFGVIVNFDLSSKWNVEKSAFSAEIHFATDHFIQSHRQRMIDDLFLKFGMSNDNPLKIVTPPHKVILKDINSDCDPYFILTRILESLSC